MKSRSKVQGFTLVEIAIVLVIIGLLLGGILKGQEMITQAKIKNVIADFSGISAAYHGYVDRYKKIPGDDPCAGGTVTLGNCGTTTGRWTGATAGDGNGIVAGPLARHTHRPHQYQRVAPVVGSPAPCRLCLRRGRPAALQRLERHDRRA